MKLDTKVLSRRCQVAPAIAPADTRHNPLHPPWTSTLSCITGTKVVAVATGAIPSAIPSNVLDLGMQHFVALVGLWLGVPLGGIICHITCIFVSPVLRVSSNGGAIEIGCESGAGGDTRAVEATDVWESGGGACGGS
jgi:hypothetical protein